MIRLTGSVLALMLVLVLGQPARAQMPAYLPANGGFGFEYTQPIPSNSLMLDRWWMVQATPAVVTPMPATAVAAPPAAVEPADPGRVARATRTGRSFSRVVSRPYNRAVVQPATSLPTGSLSWLGVASVPLYSPAQRYATYGEGYGVSPYGTVDYSASYKGMYWAP
jgi:hypothetical protein